MKNTKKLAFSALMAALGVACMYMGALFEVLDLSTAAIASICVMLVLTELGMRYAWLTFAVTGVLSLILLPTKTAAILFLGFLGFYPMAKAYFERKFRGWRCLALKILLLNVCTALMLLAVRYVMTEALWFEILTLVVANIVFVVYDVALTRLLGAYVFVWRKKLKMKF
ncbi:MAG: hypothetical protein IIU58_06695 [Clostridia bacterium]|nr:hypothetical protein [Clostridia bacterium]